MGSVVQDGNIKSDVRKRRIKSFDLEVITLSPVEIISNLRNINLICDKNSVIIA